MHQFVLVLALIASFFVDSSRQIPPTYLDCANEMNFVLKNVVTGMAMVPPINAENPDEPTVLTAQLVVVEMHGIDTEEQLLSITAMFRMSWHDKRLSAVESGSYFGALCASSNYSSWTYVVEAMNRIPWYPQWVISNGGIGILRHGAWNFYPAKVHGNGEVEWWAMYHLETECIQDVFYFPADFQKCGIKFDWPTTDPRTIKLALPTGKPAVVLREPTSALCSLWQLEAQSYHISTSSIPSIEFLLLLSRRSIFYVAAMMLPTLFINLMVLCGMIMPPMAPKKVVVAFLNLTTVFLTSIEYYEFLPKTSDEKKAPIIMYFFACHNVLAVIATAFVCFVSRVSEYREKLIKARKAYDQKVGLLPRKLEKGEEEVEDVGDGLLRTGFIGNCTRIKMSPDKMNLYGCYAYAGLCVISYIICLGIIYGLSMTKITSLKSTTYATVPVDHEGGAETSHGEVKVESPTHH